MNKNKLTAAGKKVKLVVSDIDGTLLNSDKDITKANREAIQRAREQNILFTLCTGRIVTMLEYYINTLEIATPIIAANGAIIWDPKTGKPAYEISMDSDEVKGILEICKFYQMDYCALTLETSYFSKNSVRVKHFQGYNNIAKANGVTEIRLETFDDSHHCINDLKIYKILIYDAVSRRINVIEDFIKTLKKTGYTSSDSGLLDISEVQVNKGFGIKKLAGILGLQPDEVCAVGDYKNDIPMLTFAGFPVAMGNACRELKDHAIFVTKTNDESGVAWMMENYILRK